MDLKLVEYVRTKKNAGLSSDEIKYNLLSVGWGEKEVIQALAQEADIPLPSSIPSPTTAATPSTATNFWDVFEHILLFISLYVVATSLALLLHYFVNQNFPATTYDDYGSYRSSYSDSWESALVTGYASALIVSFPIFYFLFRRITVRTHKVPQLRRGKTRKILIYLTLVGTFVILVAQAISTIYTLLNGNITFNFLLHFLITAGISGAIFAYYFNEVKEDRHALTTYEKV